MPRPRADTKRLHMSLPAAEVEKVMLYLGDPASASGRIRHGALTAVVGRLLKLWIKELEQAPDRKEFMKNWGVDIGPSLQSLTKGDDDDD